MDHYSLAGKLVLVTGGGSGIGRENCKLAASLGATVVVSDLDKASAEETKTLLESPSSDHSAFQVDVSSGQSVEELSKQIVEHYGKPPSIVIHCATIYGHFVESDECTENSWQLVMDVNLKGTFLINKTFANLMKQNGIPGSIVNLTSVAKDGLANLIPYSSSKAGICGVTKTLAQELGPYKIRCNAVAIGVIGTATEDRELTPSVVEKYLDSCALKRVGRPEEIALVCMFLASDASSYVNGIILEAHGGKIVA